MIVAEAQAYKSQRSQGGVIRVRQTVDCCVHGIAPYYIIVDAYWGTDESSFFDREMWVSGLTSSFYESLIVLVG